MREQGMAEAESVAAKRSVGARRMWMRLSLVAAMAAMLCGLWRPATVRAQDDDDDDDRRAESHAATPVDRIGMFSTIVVTRQRPAADIACMFCTVVIEGAVRGDVAVLFGTVNVGEEQTISGDVAMLASTLVVGPEARVNGDLATALSTVQLAPSAQVRGDRAIMASGLGLMVLLGPLLIAIGVVWLLVWVLRRLFAY